MLQEAGRRPRVEDAPPSGRARPSRRFGRRRCFKCRPLGLLLRRGPDDAVVAAWPGTL
uniref:Predicted protein n=1 Tax=Hordeum vulgare subsp. vulgare TaxID=112509 RepID=F2CU55_HORVV|nr:predicted protein [Hordeum vulgare subsp. vulgare]